MSNAAKAEKWGLYLCGGLHGIGKAFKPEYETVFGETITNPALSVLDFEKFAKAAHARRSR